MHLLTITLILSNALISYGNEFSKCCTLEKQLVWINSTYQCVEKTFQRLEVNAKETDFLNKNSDGECADVSTDFFIFNVSSGQIVGKRPVSESYFPKCCPLSYTYNSVLHSCEKRENVTINYIKENFVKVGLPKCKVIVDFEINETTDFENGSIDAIGKLKRNSTGYPGSFCFDKNENESFIMRECKESLATCEGIRCIKKCCPDGQSFVNSINCSDSFVHGLNLSTFRSVENPKGPYAVIQNSKCPRFYRMTEDRYNFTLDERGVFHVEGGESYIEQDIGDMQSYCIEHMKKGGTNGHLFFMCFVAAQPYEKFTYTAVFKILSCLCVVLTVAVYVILNETRKVFGKILVNYCVSLFFENAILYYAQTNLQHTLVECQFRSFLIIFFATATFCWSNVICCDIWWTFGSTKSLGHDQIWRDMKRILLYILYGWGTPFILTLIIFLFYMFPVLPYAVQPFMAETKCFFEEKKNNYAHALFFNLPHLVMQLVNLVLFIKTVVYCLRVRNQINKINDTTKDEKKKKFKKDKEKLLLIIKLSVIMGISFLFEVVSAFFDMKELGVVPKYIEVVWDAINCSQGILVFIIFVCKKKIWNDLVKKFRIFKSKSTTSINTQSTTTSNDTSMNVFSPSQQS